MTKQEFLQQLAKLLNTYTNDNSEYENIHNTYRIKLPLKGNIKREVRVAIDTYLVGKED